MKYTAFFKEQLSVAACVNYCTGSGILDKALLNSLKFLLWWNITRKVCKEAFFKERSFSLFWFSLKGILDC